MFVVKDNGKDANSYFLEEIRSKRNGTPLKEPPTDSPWKNNKFSTFEEAVEYTKLWLGSWAADFLPVAWNGSPHDYSGYGDTVSIVEE